MLVIIRVFSDKTDANLCILFDHLSRHVLHATCYCSDFCLLYFILKSNDNLVSFCSMNWNIKMYKDEACTNCIWFFVLLTFHLIFFLWIIWNYIHNKEIFWRLRWNITTAHSLCVIQQRNVYCCVAQIFFIVFICLFVRIISKISPIVVMHPHCW